MTANCLECVRSVIEARDAFETSVTSMQTSHTQLLQQLNDASTKVETASDVIQSLTNEKEEVLGLVDTQEKLVAKLKSRCEDKTNECEQLSRTLTDLDASLTSFEDRISKYQENERARARRR